jgi:hypothetical protein
MQIINYNFGDWWNRDEGSFTEIKIDLLYYENLSLYTASYYPNAIYLSLIKEPGMGYFVVRQQI